MNIGEYDVLCGAMLSDPHEAVIFECTSVFGGNRLYISVLFWAGTDTYYWRSNEYKYLLRR